MTLFMENTTVSDIETVAQIQHLLATRGATAVMVDYSDGQVAGIAFKLSIGDGREVGFRLPCRWTSVEAILKRTRKKRRFSADDWHTWARRVAWRQILRWVEAQLALIETGMVKAQEVFLPYAIVGNNQSMYQLVEERKFMALPAPTPEQANGQS